MYELVDVDEHLVYRQAGLPHMPVVCAAAVASTDARLAHQERSGPWHTLPCAQQYVREVISEAGMTVENIP